MIDKYPKYRPNMERLGRGLMIFSPRLLEEQEVLVALLATAERGRRDVPEPDCRGRGPEAVPDVPEPPPVAHHHGRAPEF
jgi:hypothetical protein